MTNDKTIVTEEGYQRIKEELQGLKQDRKNIAARLKEAKEQGDLSENAEYATAKEEQALVEGKIVELEALMKSVEVSKGSSKGIVSVGSHVAFKMDSQQMEYDIVGINEADPSIGKISNDSPIGKALIGHVAGDKVQAKLPQGEQEIEIIKVS